MATRRPLILLNGHPAELPANDTLAGATRTAASGTTTLAMSATEAEIVGFTAPAGTLLPGSSVRFRCAGFLTNSITSTNMVGRVRVGAATLTGAIVGSITQATGTTARTNFPLLITATLLVLTASTALAVVHIAPSGGAIGAPSAAVTTAVAINTAIENRVQFTFLTGGASTTGTFVTRDAQVVA